jgi:solute carrier family 25 oxoglutarate transporter 11
MKGKGDPKIFLFGGLSCQFATLFTNPIDVVKTRMQLAGELSGAPPSSSSKRPGLLSVARLLAASEGPRAFYRGLTASILREALYSSTRMGLYEPFKELFAPGVQASDLSLHVRILAGGFAGAFGALVSNPTDLVRVRMQVSYPLPSTRFSHHVPTCRFRPTPGLLNISIKTQCMHLRRLGSWRASAACGKGPFPICSVPLF